MGKHSIDGFLQLRGWLVSAVLVCVCGPVMSGRAAQDDYRIGPGDLIKVGVFDHPELAADIRISQSGNITFPLVGTLSVDGLSTGDVEKSLAERLASGGFVRQAQVSVLVVEFQSQKVAVMGQVAKPGQYPLTGSNKVLDLLAEAGGVVNTIAGDQATLVRRDGSRVMIDLIALFEGDPNQNPWVIAGDTIFVPKAPQFYIYGEVQKPGAYRLERAMTASRALSTSGGLTVRGSERRIVVKRRDITGKETSIPIDGSILLQPDDVVLVKERIF